MYKYFFLFIIFCFLSCKNADKTRETSIEKPELDILKKHELTIILNPLAKTKVKSWKEYQIVESTLQKFKEISTNEALNNALDLAEVIKQLKDSIRPKELINPSFRTRINVLENESLRLKDMTLIKNAISINEINAQVDKILDAFSATNSKINTIYSQLEVEKEIEKTTTY